MTLAIDWLIHARLRDGVRLGLRLCRPEGAGPLPVLLTMTPYGIDRNHAAAMALARAGHAVAVADCRGRGESEGCFEPSFRDAEDGFDLVEWLARQPFCDGRVAMWGGSYQGENQWATFRAGPPALSAIAPAAAAYMPADRPWRGPQRMPYALLWLLLVSGRTPALGLFAETEHWEAVWLRHFRPGAAFRDLPRAMGATAPWWDPYLDHPAHDPFWQRLAIPPATFAARDLPVLTVTGLFDSGQEGALACARLHEAHAPAARVARHAVVIGPGDHAGTRSGAPVAGLDLGPAAEMDLGALTAAIFDHSLKGAPRPAFLAPRVRWFETGSNLWRGAASLAACGARRHEMPLAAMDEGGGEGPRLWLSDSREERADLMRRPFPETIRETVPPEGG